MKLYFSGIGGHSEYKMLEKAGIKHLLVDPVDYEHISPKRLRVALDSGAYRGFKRGYLPDLEKYLAFARSHGPFDFAVSLDVIRDPKASRENWERIQQLKRINDPTIFIPVFQWGGESDDLKRYLDEAPVVGIGGLVLLMRNKNKEMLDQLGELCSKHPNRFHIFGINFLKAIEQLKNLIISGDTSKWLDAARYRHLLFTNTITGKLSQAPAKALGHDLSREELCIQSARNLEDFTLNKDKRIERENSK
jgi:hypothetical protein